MAAFTGSLIMIVIVCMTLFAGVVCLALLERKILGRMQARRGPQRAGPLGLSQPLADSLKLVCKENISISVTDPVLYRLAPFIALVATVSMASLIPFGNAMPWFGIDTALRIADVNVGLIYVLTFSLCGIFGILLAGWSSANSFALLAGLRASMLVMSCEIPLACSCAGVLMQAGSLSLVTLVEVQAQQGWFVYHIQGIGFVVFLICAVMKCNRTPFDQIAASSELAAGHLMEYAGVKYALFRLTEYAGIILMSAFMVTLFFGGWIPLPWVGAPRGPLWLGPIWFWLKVFGFCFLFVWLRATLPRFRPDQVVKLGWEVLFPLSLINIVLTAVMLGS